MDLQQKRIIYLEGLNIFISYQNLHFCRSLIQDLQFFCISFSDFGELIPSNKLKAFISRLYNIKMGNQQNNIFLDEDNSPQLFQNNLFGFNEHQFLQQEPLPQANNARNIQFVPQQIRPRIQQRQVPENEVGEQIFYFNLHDDVGKKKKCKLETKKVETSSQCPICCVGIRKNTKVPDLKCKHIFHKKCLTTWLKKGDKCPLCRDDIN